MQIHEMPKAWAKVSGVHLNSQSSGTNTNNACAQRAEYSSNNSNTSSNTRLESSPASCAQSRRCRLPRGAVPVPRLLVAPTAHEIKHSSSDTNQEPSPTTTTNSYQHRLQQQEQRHQQQQPTTDKNHTYTVNSFSPREDKCFHGRCASALRVQNRGVLALWLGLQGRDRGGSGSAGSVGGRGGVRRCCFCYCQVSSVVTQ